MNFDDSDTELSEPSDIDHKPGIMNLYSKLVHTPAIRLDALDSPLRPECNQCEHVFVYCVSHYACYRCWLVREEPELIEEVAGEDPGKTFIRKVATSDETKMKYLSTFINTLDGEHEATTNGIVLEDALVESDWNWSRIWRELKAVGRADLLCAIPQSKGISIDLHALHFFEIYDHFRVSCSRVNSPSPQFALRQICITLGLFGIAKWIPVKLAAASLCGLLKEWSGVFSSYKYIRPMHLKSAFDSSDYNQDLYRLRRLPPTEFIVLFKEVRFNLYTESLLMSKEMFISTLLDKPLAERYLTVIVLIKNGKLIPSELQPALTPDDDKAMVALAEVLYDHLTAVHAKLDKIVTKHP